MTPREFRAYSEVFQQNAKKNERESYELALYQAYQREVFARTEKLKPFKEYYDDLMKSFNGPFEEAPPEISQEKINKMRKMAEDKGLRHPWNEVKP